MKNNFVFVMAGGSGERFWPMSRAATPKHLLKIMGDRTLLEATVRRLEGLVPRENIFILTNSVQRDAAVKELPFLSRENIIAEPAKRDTAPACALATALARVRGGEEAVCAMLPADAMIHDGGRFRAQMDAAFESARELGAIVTFAIPPKYPATGFGYLHMEHNEGNGPIPVRRFVEKPDLETARAYLADGGYGWNAGIFLWRAGLFLEEARKHVPDLADFIEGFPEGNPTDYLAERFELLPKISVDYAILERAARVVAFRAEFDWDDVGSWTALPAHLPVDDHGNCVTGNAVLHEASGNIVVADSRLVALCGVSDLVVVETADAVLISHRDAAQDIKKLQPHLPDEVR
jgi:mannose-1-phosphate guanylyltransferase